MLADINTDVYWRISFFLVFFKALQMFSLNISIGFQQEPVSDSGDVSGCYHPAFYFFNAGNSGWSVQAGR